MENFSKATDRERRDYILQRYSALKDIRAPYLKNWLEIVKYIAPYSGCFHLEDITALRDQRYILDNKAARCIDDLVGALGSYATPKTLPWFRLTGDTEESRYDHAAQLWLGQVQSVLNSVLFKSNTYDSLHAIYRDLCVFGTAASIMVEDPVRVVHHHVLPVGSFCIQNDNNGQVSTLYREFELTVAQAAREFGLSNLSKNIKEAYDQGNLEAKFKFLHAIEPREDRNLNSSSNLDMAWASYYVELGNDKKGILRESGYPYFPCIVPRWDIHGNEPYGISPALLALPDIKSLMHITLSKAKMVDIMIEPPLQVPLSARQNPVSLYAGSVNYVPTTGNDQSIKPILQQTGSYEVVSNEVDKLHQRIEQTFFHDIFFMLQQFATTRKTATEVTGLREEKMAVLGPVVERLQRECQEPLINVPYRILRNAGVIPDPPASLLSTLGGKEFEIKFEGLLAQSQRAMAIAPTAEFIATIQSTSASLPDAIYRIDIDGLVDVLADLYGINRTILRDKQAADRIRQEVAQQQQQQQDLAAGESIGNTINTLAQAQKAGADASLATTQMDGSSLMGL